MDSVLPNPLRVDLHGHSVTYHQTGTGPPLLLLHGISSSSQTWRRVIEPLAEHHTVIAPDLLGHGTSAKPQGDYSLGAYASGVRDLMIALGFPRATVVGHSLGGGIAMQLAYQFPERVERLVLVSSGGLGREVGLMLRAATLPGSEYVLPLLCQPFLRDVASTAGGLLARVGIRPNSDIEGIAAGFASLGEDDARRAFIQTARSVMDIGGQRVDATDRLYLTAHLPTQIVWGERDPMIPVSHACAAHALMPGSRLDVFAGAGHFPFNDEPDRFVATLRSFMSETEPADIDEASIRALLVGSAPVAA